MQLSSSCRCTVHCYSMITVSCCCTRTVQHSAQNRSQTDEREASLRHHATSRSFVSTRIYGKTVCSFLYAPLPLCTRGLRRHFSRGFTPAVWEDCPSSSYDPLPPVQPTPRHPSAIDKTRLYVQTHTLEKSTCKGGFPVVPILARSSAVTCRIATFR
jgi:hypothetical protein